MRYNHLPNHLHHLVYKLLNYFYYFDNIVPVNYPEIVNKFDPDYYRKNEKNTKLILWQGQNPENPDNVLNFVSQNFECKNLKKLEEFSFYVGRFFLINKKKDKNFFILYKLDC